MPSTDRARGAWQRAAPVATVLGALLVVWYAGAVWLNAPQVIERSFSGQPGWALADLVRLTLSMNRPVLPAPHQIALDLVDSVFGWPVDSPRNLLYHAAVTSSATLLGFAMGTLLGALLAVAIVHSRTLDRSLFPWIIASQTVPVLAIAPIVIVILGSLGMTGVFPKAIISMYLCFFPVAVAMVKGLRSPGVIELELLHTYAASRAATFWTLRVPASLPFLFPSLRVGIAAGLVGAIVGELPTGAQAGLGARLLTGSYYGNTVQIWSALVMSALLGLVLTGCVAGVERAVAGRGADDDATPPILPTLALLLVAASFALPVGEMPGLAVRWTHFAAPLVFAGCALFAAFLATLRGVSSLSQVLVYVALTALAALAPLLLLAVWPVEAGGPSPFRAGFWCYLGALFLLALVGVRRLAAQDAAGAWSRYGTPLVFGAWLLVFWQLLTQALDVPRVLLPAPSVIGQALVQAFGVLAADFVQTVLHSVLIGLAAGAFLGFGVGVLIDRSPFLQRGLLPVAALASAVPLVGIAPVMVMWFGFDWPSKAAVVVVMTFFPMLVNTLAGLRESGAMERDLMRSYGAGYWRTLLSLRLPVALPFVFNALKIDTTLALIGAIVAEFFGSPTEGLGFRISTEAARLNMGLVWAAIFVAAVTGSVLYALVAALERRATFWHPSIRTT